jgi:hypothetical protein
LEGGKKGKQLFPAGTSITIEDNLLFSVARIICDLLELHRAASRHS